MSPEERQAFIASVRQFFEEHGRKPLSEDEKKAVRLVGPITPRRRPAA